MIWSLLLSCLLIGLVVIGEDSIPTLPFHMIKGIKSNVDPEATANSYLPLLATAGCQAWPAIDIEGYFPVRLLMTDASREVSIRLSIPKNNQVPLRPGTAIGSSDRCIAE